MLALPNLQLPAQPREPPNLRIVPIRYLGREICVQRRLPRLVNGRCACGIADPIPRRAELQPRSRKVLRADCWQCLLMPLRNNRMQILAFQVGQLRNRLQLTRQSKQALVSMANL